MVYLIHFDQPYKHAQHYLGFVESDLEARIAKHKAGTGAKLLRIVNNVGIKWNVVRTWKDGDRSFERRLKNMGSSKRHCPICKKK